MTFEETLAQVWEVLEREGRVAYRMLKRRFALDDDNLEDLKADLIDAKHLAVDEAGKVLVWTRERAQTETENRGNGESEKKQTTASDARRKTRDPRPSDGERRQLTVMFCDLVGSTALSTQLDPEDLRDVVRMYHQTCAEVIQRYDGHIAQPLGDGLLVYFGYPAAHEDDARRAVRAGVEIVAALQHQHVAIPSNVGARRAVPLPVRIGIHTGLVVIGEISAGSRSEQLALGETPNIAARIQGLAESNSVLVSAATHRLVGRYFECQPFGSHLVKGLETPLAVYHVQSERQSVAPGAGYTTLTPLVGRDQEVGLLRERWEQVKEGRGQVVLLSGEPGIGKSRLPQTLTEQVSHEGSLALETRCSPYHQNSAFYPLIDSVQRTLLFDREDTAYQSLLKSRRQQLHQQIAHVLEARFSDTKETQPELLAHHYTEAGLIEQAIPYWQRAGERATQRSANAEAINHLTKGLAVLKTLPDTPARAERELHIHMALGTPLIATTGLTSPELERTYERAYELCQQLGEAPELFGVLWGLWVFHLSGQSALQTARKLAEQLLRLAQYQDDPTRLQIAHLAMANTLFFMGELPATREHVERAIALHDAAMHYLIDLFGGDQGMLALSYAALTLWLLGFPDQALKRSTEAVTQAQERAHPFNLATGLEFAALFHVLRGEGQLTKECAKAAMTLSTELGFAMHLAWGPMHQGWVLGEQGHHESGIELLRKGLSLSRASGFVIWVPFYLGLLAGLHGKIGQAEEGLSVLAEAREISNKKGDRWCEAELYRLTGELTLAQSRVHRPPSTVHNPQSAIRNPQSEAEACFWKAIEIARQQQARSWELRASTSLARLWQQQDKKDEARQMLAEIYGWFTEGFETKDLQEAKALLDEWAEGR